MFSFLRNLGNPKIKRNNTIKYLSPSSLRKRYVRTFPNSSKQIKSVRAPQPINLFYLQQPIKPFRLQSPEKPFRAYDPIKSLVEQQEQQPVKSISLEEPTVTNSLHDEIRRKIFSSVSRRGWTMTIGKVYGGCGCG